MNTLRAALAGVIVAAFFWAAGADATGKVVTIGTQVTGNLVPWRGSGASMRFQCLWLQKDINCAGYINAVEFMYSSGSSSGAFNNCRVWLCHTTKNDLEYIFDNNYTGNTPVKVLDELSLILRGPSWIDIGIDANTFNYNNRDNLLMEIRWKGDSGNNIYCKTYNVFGGRIWATSDVATQGTVLDDGQYIRLHIGTMSGETPTSLGRVKALFR